MLEEQKDKLEDLSEKYQDELTEAIEESIETLESQSDIALEAYETQIEALESEIDAIKEANRVKKESIALSEKELELAKLKEQRENILNERNTKILRDGEFVFEANPTDLRKNAEDIANVEKELLELIEENEYDARLRKLEEEKDIIEEQKEDTKDGYDDRIQELKDFNTEQKRQIQREGKIQESLLDSIRSAIIASDREHWQEKIDGYKDMVFKINQALADINQIDVDILANQQNIDSVSSGGGVVNTSDTIRVRHIESGGEGTILRKTYEKNPELFEALDTGGITNSDGVAMLHKDEVVLNPAQVSRSIEKQGLKTGSASDNAKNMFALANSSPSITSTSDNSQVTKTSESIIIQKMIVQNPTDLNDFVAQSRNLIRNRS